MAVMTVTADHARGVHSALQERNRATQEAKEAEAVRVFLEGMLALANPSVSQGRTVTVEEAVDEVVEDIVEEAAEEIAEVEAAADEVVDEIVAEAAADIREALRGRHRALLLRIARSRRKPPEEGYPVPAIPPGGPFPKQGGAEAPLEFD